MKNAVFVTALSLAAQTLAKPLTLDAVEADIKEVELQRNLWNLNHIAKSNGGNRAAGLPGYDKSVDFVLERAKRFRKIDVYTQPFTVPWYTVNGVTLTGPDGEDVYVLSPTANIDGTVTGELAETPIDDVNGSMCSDAAYEGVDVVGKIALIKRGICGFVTKLQLAAAHGAIGVVMYNSPASGTNYAGPDIGFVDPESIVPVVIPTLETGTAWRARLVAGETLTVTIGVDAVYESRIVENIIAETKEGDPNNVIMLGAHLDSVRAGAGINDDGSGVTALMEIMGSFQKYSGFANKVRFGWWGAEEEGLIGSLFYGDSLSDEEASKIKFYFNYDMIGSIEPQYWIYADGAADEYGGQELWEYIASAGKTPVWYGSYTNDSDYVAFRDHGIPVSGLFTGAGAPEDPCYHSACDALDNINYEALTINSKAAARAAAKLALSLEGIPLKSRDVAGSRAATQLPRKRRSEMP